MTKVILLLASIAVILGLVLFAWLFVFKGGSSSKINTSRAAVIKEIQSLNRLETASYTIEKIIDAGTTDSNALSNFFFGDKILLIAHGKVIAGFDLSKIDEKDITINGQDLKIKLPPPQVLVATLDNSQTRVYDRQKGILNQGETNLESEARKAAEASIREAACQGGILQQASDNGRKQLSALFYALGFTTVNIEIPSASC